MGLFAGGFAENGLLFNCGTTIGILFSWSVNSCAKASYVYFPDPIFIFSVNILGVSTTPSALGKGNALLNI